MVALSVLAHHSEPSDPVLLRWILDTFQRIFGYGPLEIVIPVGIVVVAFPVVLGFLAMRSRRAAGHAVDDTADGERMGRLAK